MINPYYHQGKPYCVTRCGIIPYASVNGDIKLLMARKKHWGCFLGDFGGGIKKHESWLQGLTREIDEESNNIFGSADDFLTKVLYKLTTKKMIHITKSLKSVWIEFLVEIDYSEDYVNNFARFGNNEEILRLKWLDLDKITDKQSEILGNKLDGTIIPFVHSIVEELRLLPKVLPKILPVCKMITSSFIGVLIAVPKLKILHKPLVINKPTFISVRYKHRYAKQPYKGLAYITPDEKIRSNHKIKYFNKPIPKFVNFVQPLQEEEL